MLAVIGENHAFIADEKAAAIPLRDSSVLPELGFALSLIPGELDRREAAARAVFVGGAHRSGRNLWMRRGSTGLHREWRLQLERPGRKVVPVAAQVANG